MFLPLRDILDVERLRVWACVTRQYSSKARIRNNWHVLSAEQSLLLDQSFSSRQALSKTQTSAGRFYVILKIGMPEAITYILQTQYASRFRRQRTRLLANLVLRRRLNVESEVVVVLALDGSVFSIHRDLLFGHKLDCLVHRKAQLAAENLFCSTLGAAYASITRDKSSVAHARKAKQFAERQLKVAERLNDPQLFGRAMVYVGYYHMFMRQFDLAGRIFAEQRLTASPNSELFDLASAALARLQLTIQTPDAHGVTYNNQEAR